MIASAAVAGTWSTVGSAVEIEVGRAAAVDPALVFTPSMAVPFSVASDGFDWLVLYSQGGDYGYGDPLVAVRVGADGKTLDQPGIEIASPSYLTGGGAVFDGVDYAVAWGEYAGSGKPFYVRGRRIGSDGSLLGPATTIGTVNPAPPRIPHVAVAAGSSGELVVWCVEPVLDGPGECRWAKLVGSDVVGTDKVPLAAGVVNLAVAASGDAWLLTATTWDDELVAVRVGEDGKSLDDLPVSIATSAYEPSVAAAVDGWQVVFTKGNALRGAQVSADGAVALVQDPLFSELPGISGARLAPVPTGYALVGERDDSAVALFLDGDLAVTSPVSSVEGYSVAGGVSAAWGDQSLLVPWAGTIGLSYTTYTFGKRLDENGVALDAERLAISTAPSEQLDPLVAAGPGAWLVAWTDDRLGTPGVYAQRLDQCAAPSSADSDAILITDEAWSEQLVAVAGSSQGWLVVWSDELSRLRAKLVDGSGVPSAESIELGSRLGGVVNAIFDGSDWIVSWLELDGYTGMGTATIARITSTGEMIGGEPIALSETNEAVGGVDVEADSQGYVVSWQAKGGDLVLRRVDENGVVLGDGPTALVPDSEDVYWYDLEYRGGEGWLLAAHSDSSYHGSFRALGADATVQTFDLGFGIDLTALGDHALVVWPVENEDEYQLGLADVHGALESKRILSLDTFDSWHPRLAARDDDDAIVVFESYEAFGGPRSTRVKARRLRLVADSGTGSAGAPGAAGAEGVGDGPEGDCSIDEPSGGAGGVSGSGGTSDSGGNAGDLGGGGTITEPGSSGGESNEGGHSGTGTGPDGAAGMNVSDAGEPSSPSRGEAGAGDGPSNGGASSASPGGSGDTEGCGCRTPGSARDHHPLVLGLLVAGVAFRRRRLRRPH